MQMNERNHNSNRQADDEKTLSELLRLAGPRRQVPEDVEARVYERVLSEWQAARDERRRGSSVYATVRGEWTRKMRRRKAARWYLPAALAATALLAFMLLDAPEAPAPATVTIGTVARVVANTPRAGLPEAGEKVAAGARLATGPGEALTLSLRNGESLRIDENSVVVADTRSNMSLLAGRLYVDTGSGVYRDGALVVHTAVGVVRDIGTQFSVAVDPSGLEVAVREGRVEVDSDGTEVGAEAGERLHVSKGAGFSTSRLQPWDASWDWATQLAPEFDIEGKSLLEFLTWVARETGRELVFADESQRLAAMRTDLHGSIAGQEPLAALESVLVTTRFRHVVDEGSILIER
jgi:ferric-dicitrate binding protein FerR (iron transport regulator)